MVASLKKTSAEADLVSEKVADMLDAGLTDDEIVATLKKSIDLGKERENLLRDKLAMLRLVLAVHGD